MVDVNISRNWLILFFVVVVIVCVGIAAYSLGQSSISDVSGDEDWLATFFSLLDSDDSDSSVDPEDIDPYDGPEYQELPESVHIAVSPNPVPMDSRVTGQLTGDGRYYNIETEVTHFGTGDKNLIPGTVGESGQWLYSENVHIPGVWRFVTTAENGVVSNVAELSVHGILLELESNFYSRSFRDSLLIECCCHYVNQDLTFIVDDGVTESPIGTVRVNSGGYASMSYNFDGYSGDIEIDCVVSGDKASYWETSQILTVGR